MNDIVLVNKIVVFRNTILPMKPLQMTSNFMSKLDVIAELLLPIYKSSALLLVGQFQVDLDGICEECCLNSRHKDIAMLAGCYNKMQWEMYGSIRQQCICQLS